MTLAFSQCLTIENLETRCEELQKKIDDLTSQKEVLLRQQTANQNPAVVQTQSVSWKAAVTPGGSIKQVLICYNKQIPPCLQSIVIRYVEFHYAYTHVHEPRVVYDKGMSYFFQSAAPSSPSVFQETNNDSSNLQQLSTTASNDEELTDLLIQLQEARSQRAREQKKVAELGQQLTTLLQENSTLEEQLTFWRSKAQDVKNLQDEINTLEEVRCVCVCYIASFKLTHAIRRHFHRFFIHLGYILIR